MATILIVDDDAAWCSALTDYLWKTGRTPMVAPTGHAALRAARVHPDVILLDLSLPDMAAEEVLRRLKRDPSTAQIPVVAIAGEGDAEDRVPRDGAGGAVAVLQEPILGSELCAVVDGVLESREAETRAPRGEVCATQALRKSVWTRDT